MKPYRTIIVDDEKAAIDSMIVLLEDFPELTIVNTFISSKEALEFVLKEKPDFIFLDIKMPEISGLEFARKLIELKSNSSVIFVTAFDEYVLEALRNNAVDYLLKPVTFVGLKEAIERFKARNKTESIGNLNKFIKSQQRRKLRFNTRNGFISIYEDEILFLKADGVYSDIFLISGKEITVSQNLGRVEEQLYLPELIKIHRSTIINGNHIFEINRGKKECTLILNKKTFKLPASNDGIKVIEKYLNC